MSKAAQNVLHTQLTSCLVECGRILALATRLRQELEVEGMNPPEGFLETLESNINELGDQIHKANGLSIEFFKARDVADLRRLKVRMCYVKTSARGLETFCEDVLLHIIDRAEKEKPK